MNFKYLFLFSIIFTLSSNAQSKYAEEAETFFWGETDIYKNSIDIPEKWQNESAVVIYKNENYDFHKYGKKVTYKTSIRKRIKLLDKAAVEEFSEFSFTERFRTNKGRYSWQKKGNNVIGVKVIKPDGKENIIDVTKDAVEVDGETKLAIANLEVGDIIDYYFYKVEPFKSAYQFGFDPVETTLSEEYPIMDYKLFFETENDFFINFKSFNGAPDLKELSIEKKNTRRYVLESSDIEKSEYIRWSYPLTQKPAYKFQVYFARSGRFEDYAMAFLPEKEDIIKKSVSKDEVLNLYDTRFKASGKLNDVRRHFKKKEFTNNETLVTEAYYFMRHYYLTRFVEAFYVKESGIDGYPFYVYGNPVFIQNQKQFIRHFTAFLTKEKINYEIVVAKKRYDGSIDDLLIEKNVEVLIKVLTDTPLYASFFNSHTSINQFTPLLESTKVYLLSKERYVIDQIKEGQLPTSSYLDNESDTKINLTLNEDFSGFTVKKENKIKGHQKIDLQTEILSFQDYVYEDYKRYKTKPYLDYLGKRKKEVVDKEIKALADKIRTIQEERFEKNIKNEFELSEINDYNFNIKETGRYGLNQYFVYDENYTFNDAFIKKAGTNYIIEIGKFIGGQIDISKDERDRDLDVQVAFARSLKNTIIFNIPEGYTVSGLDKLESSVDNETGTFKSTAKVEGNTLIIDTVKNYKNNFEPAENWPKMLLFLDEALDFTNAKIFLKKG